MSATIVILGQYYSRVFIGECSKCIVLALFLVECSKFLDYCVVVSTPLMFNNCCAVAELQCELVLHILKPF